MSAILQTYNRKKISFKRGKGSYLYASNGKKYLDFVQGIAVNSLGHSHPHLIKAINSQSKKLWHVSNAFNIPEQEKLAKRLTQKTFANFVAFQNSGAEATELAIKIARKYYETEASGNINLKTVKSVAATGVDRISIGSITHSAEAVDFKLEI